MTEEQKKPEDLNGMFKGKILDYGLRETEDGGVQAMVGFSFEIPPKAEGEAPTSKSLTWFGTLKEGRGQEITLDALIVMGYTSKSFADFANSKGLNTDAEYMLTIETAQELDKDKKPKFDDQGKPKMRTQIRWINPLGGGAMKNKLAAGDAISKIKGMNLDAALSMRMKEKGVTPKTTATGSGSTTSTSAAGGKDLDF